MKQALYTVEEVSVMIRKGKKLLLAGNAQLLSQLPEGDWIGGSTPYFILYPEQMIEFSDKLFVTRLPDFVETMEIREYDAQNIKNIYRDAPQNGFTVLIIPFGSPVFPEFAMNAPTYPDFARYPLCGWISGQPFEILHSEKSYVRSGASDVLYSDKAVAVHISLPANKYAELHMFNPYEQGTGDVITFDYSGQFAKDAFINGEKRNIAQYLREIKDDISNLPLVANYSGAMMNLCYIFADDKIHLSAPVFEHVEYRIAKINDQLPEPELNSGRVAFSVTCATNFLQPEFCKKYIKKMNGPVVFGEIVYQLVNQTTAFVTIDDVSPNAEMI